MEAIQNLGQIVVRVLIVGTLGEGNNVSHTQNGELDTLQRVAVLPDVASVSVEACFSSSSLSSNLSVTSVTSVEKVGWELI